jgi:hypothetical protein
MHWRSRLLEWQPGRRTAAWRQSLFYPEVARFRPALVASGRLILRRPAETVAAPVEAAQAAERVLGAYRLAMTEGRERGETLEGLWRDLVHSNYAPLRDALAGGDPARLAEVLEPMFGTTLTTGLSMGGEVQILDSRRGRAYFIDWWLDGLLCLAAYLGIMGETMEYGQSALRTPRDIDNLYSAVQRALGIDLTFPHVANSWGVEYRGTLTPRSAWRHIHSAHQLSVEARGIASPRFVEVGAGFAGVAFWLRRFLPSCSYTAYDLPIVNAIAGYFLLRAFPTGRIVLADDEWTLGDGEPHLALQPYWRIEDEPDRSCDVALNQDSLPEMPRHAAERYIETFDRIVRVAFQSENHEGGELWDRHDPSTAQLRLPELEGRFTRLARAHRYRAWMRRGYVETVYRPRVSNS